MKEIELKVTTPNDEIAGDIMKMLATFNCNYSIVKDDKSRNYSYLINDIPYSRLCDIKGKSNKQYRRDMDTYKSVGNILLSFGISSSKLGFNYIIECIRLINIYGLYNFKLSEDVYPVISKWYDVSSSSIEHSIRNAIEAAWDRYIEERPISSGMNYFLKRPTNRIFLNHIARISSYLVADSY